MAMNSETVVGAILRAVNDHSVTQPYGDSLLLDLPLTYGDGDAVRLLVEPIGEGYRVSDRATATTLLSMSGVNFDHGRPAEAIAEAARLSGLNGFNAVPGELATYGSKESLGELVLAVAQASMRVDQLRWLAVKQPLVRFPDQVVDRVKEWATKDGRRVRREAPMRLSSGRERQVTLQVSSANKAAYVQAVSGRDQEQAAEHCYHIFSWAVSRILDRSS
ncbi:hypothetical protein O7608_07565 [Solwaraspora sp. WMMA2056]|uniref:hypothetical protein n=1 Tax=Solwaraspora sp. WMMA2056 TaxID=3015161 RepID=UPI00259B3D74|nr:hypothetical protein [Solwaraspora sp. WMMA2056]WJK42236.1 hypothetical protein O7608_07565 [Solwaraspora sp. WMMA2056]